MPLLRAWLFPIFTTVPTDIRMSGMIPMSALAAINPMSWLKPPFYGIVTYMIVWWWLWNSNHWELIKKSEETFSQNWFVWFLRTSFWSFLFNPFLLFIVYMAILAVVRLSAIDFGAFLSKSN